MPSLSTYTNGAVEQLTPLLRQEDLNRLYGTIINSKNINEDPAGQAVASN